jgi:2',3'-cyclic-nucleotide 2'-phosphodiesterase (5'-nucleotidase family)
VPQLDLILGGHSHDTLAQPEWVGAVPIVHAGPYGAFASRTELVRDGGRARIVDFALEPLLGPMP